MCTRRSDLAMRHAPSFWGTAIDSEPCQAEGDAHALADGRGPDEALPPRFLRLLRGTGWLSAVGAAACLSGCWTPPAASLPQDARPGAVATPLMVRAVVHSATVEAVGCNTRTITLRAPDAPAESYAIGPRVKDWQGLSRGDELDAHVKLELTVFVPEAAERRPEGGTAPRHPDARVLMFEPSYRMLTLQYPNGATEIFKVSLSAHVRAIPPGSWVTIRPVEAVALHARHKPAPNAGECLLRSATALP